MGGMEALLCFNTEFPTYILDQKIPSDFSIKIKGKNPKKLFDQSNMYISYNREII